MKRDSIVDEFKWRREDIFGSVAEWERELSALNKVCVEVLKFKGKLGERLEFIACMKFQEAIGERLEKLYCYASLYMDENAKVNESNVLKSKAETLFVSYSTMSSFFSPEMSALDMDILDGYAKSEEMKEYRYFISEIIRSKKHILSAKEEKLLSMGGKVYGGYSDVFGMINNVDLPFPIMMIDGVRQRLTHGTYSALLQNSDQRVRKNAFNNMYKAVESLINTVAANYTGSVQKDNYLAEARGYGSALEKSLHADNVPSKVCERLIGAVGKNLAPLHEYVKFRKKALGLDKQYMYDLHVPIVKDCGMSLEYGDAYFKVLKGLEPLGEEYALLLRRAKDSRWIDVYESENKRSGAYSMGVAGVHPYVLLNYTKTTHDVFTIAHELGHAAHSYYSSREQSYINADYSIFVAEVASTVNEVLLLKYLLKEETNKDMRKFLLSYYLDMFRTTLFRQTMFAEFEAIVHADEQSGKALTVESLSEQYYELNRKYYGSGVVHNKQIKFEWARIPHFYSAFYVYKYATGITSAVSIARGILSGGDEAVVRYKKFLCAGGSKSPYEILCDAGVDLMTDKPYDDVMTEFRVTLEELKSLF